MGNREAEALFKCLPALLEMRFFLKYLVAFAVHSWAEVSGAGSAEHFRPSQRGSLG